jgi:Na+/H+ antiporter NhaD/arsenite permease-like protein
LIGAVANLIVAQSAESRGVRIDFWSFTRAGLIVAPVTVAASVGVLAIEQALGLVR